MGMTGLTISFPYRRNLWVSADSLGSLKRMESLIGTPSNSAWGNSRTWSFYTCTTKGLPLRKRSMSCWIWSASTTISVQPQSIVCPRPEMQSLMLTCKRILSVVVIWQLAQLIGGRSSLRHRDSSGFALDIFLQDTNPDDSYNCERYFKFHQVNEKREVLLDMSYVWLATRVLVSLFCLRWFGQRYMFIRSTTLDQIDLLLTVKVPRRIYLPITAN